MNNPTGPLVTIFVRHSRSCNYRGDEAYRRCHCPKHLRWFWGGNQFRQSARTRSWAQAELAKRNVEDRFCQGATAAPLDDRPKTIGQAIEIFLVDKRNEGVELSVEKKYERELERLRVFMERRSRFFPHEIDREDLIAFQATWSDLYPSTQTRSRVLTRARAFMRFCYESGWIDRIPKFSRVKIEQTPTLPLTGAEYKKLLNTVAKVFASERMQRRVRALVELMRHTGLSIRDAVTLERAELIRDGKRKLYRVVTQRTKTGTDVSVILPKEVSARILAAPNDNPRYLFWNTGTGKEKSAVTNWQHDLRKLFHAAGFPGGHPHQLRDTFAVGLLEKGVPLEEVAKLLGHESVRTTEKHYAPWVKRRQDRLDELVAGTWERPRSRG